MAKKAKEEVLGEDQLICVLSGNVIYDSIVADVGEYKEKLAVAADLENEAIAMVEREIAKWQGEGR